MEEEQYLVDDEDQRVTKAQKRLMIEYMKEAVGMEDRKDKDEHWEKVQLALNRNGPPRKTIIQWKKIWRDMRCNTKKKLMEIKRTRPGSPCPVELNKEDHQIIDIVGAGSDYFEEGGEGRELMNFEYAQPDETVCESEIEKNIIKNYKEPLEESAINIPGEKKSFALPASVECDEHRGKLSYITPKNSNSFGMDDKVLSTLLESIAAASKIQKQRKELPDPDKLFLLSFVNALKNIPESIKYDVKSDIINVFRKWQDVLGQASPHENNQGASSSCISPPMIHHIQSTAQGMQHSIQPHIPQHPLSVHPGPASITQQVTMRQENGGF